MDVTMINTDSPFLVNARVFPPLGLPYITSVFKSEVINNNTIDLSGGRFFLEEVRSDIFGITCTTTQYHIAKAIPKKIRPHNPILKVIIGRFHPSPYPKPCISNWNENQSRSNAG